jgi:hypothetical protein
MAPECSLLLACLQANALLCNRSKDTMPLTLNAPRFNTVLNDPKLYSLFKRLIGGKAGSQIMVDQYIRPQAGDKVLDIGCGSGHYFSFFPADVEYVGFDSNP